MKDEGGKREESGRPVSLSSFRLHPSSLASWLDRALIACLFGLAACAPHSIAATQGFWALALVVWAARFSVRPRPRLFRTPVDYALLVFFLLTALSAFLSYAPDISVAKLRGASLFTIVYLVAQNVASRRTMRWLAFVLIASCMVNVAFTLGERAIGRGVRVDSLTANSPLRAAGVQDGDTLLEVDGMNLRQLEELDTRLNLPARENGGEDAPTAVARVRVYRFEATPVFEVRRDAMLDGTTAQERLGISAWSRGREWRASGFYGHYTTYAEALQLILSLTLGLFIALRRKRSWPGVLLGVSVAGMFAALILTVTRASWLAFLVSAFVIVLVGAASRRAALVMILAVLMIVPLGLFFLQQKRNVGFFDRRDGSTTWRMTVYREAVELLVSSPRHLAFGVGMDSIKRFRSTWGMFDNGRLPVGHLHSTPLQLAVERGLPALAAWLALLLIYARMLWRLMRSKFIEQDWIERGIVLGALGGLAGFFTSGLVHYNFGDSEAAMIFYFIMGLALVVERMGRERAEPGYNRTPAIALRRAT